MGARVWGQEGCGVWLLAGPDYALGGVRMSGGRLAPVETRAPDPSKWPIRDQLLLGHFQFLRARMGAVFFKVMRQTSKTMAKSSAPKAMTMASAAPSMECRFEVAAAAGLATMAAPNTSKRALSAKRRLRCLLLFGLIFGPLNCVLFRFSQRNTRLRADFESKMELTGPFEGVFVAGTMGRQVRQCIGAAANCQLRGLW